MPYKDKDKRREYDKKYLAAITPEQKEAKRIWQRDYARKKRAAGGEHLKEQARVWSQLYRDRDPLRARVSVHQSGVRRRNPAAMAATNITDTELHEWLKVEYNKPCRYCGEVSTHIDHKLPLTKGGQHQWDNIELICAACNIAKRDRTPEDFLAHVKRIADFCL